jgi:cytochrome c oxidase subunit 3
MNNTAMTPGVMNRKSVAKTTLVVLIATETAFFGTLLMSYLYLRTGQADWPYMNHTLQRLIVPGLNTLLLVASAIVARLTVRSADKGDSEALKRGLAVVTLMGLVFVVGQVFEFTRNGMRPDDLAFGGVFFTLMGFHALHVIAGLVLNGMNLYRAELGDFGAEEHVPISVGAWFWYFVTIVWIVLFLALYLV